MKSPFPLPVKHEGAFERVFPLFSLFFSVIGCSFSRFFLLFPLKSFFFFSESHFLRNPFFLFLNQRAFVFPPLLISFDVPPNTLIFFPALPLPFFFFPLQQGPPLFFSPGFIKNLLVSGLIPFPPPPPQSRSCIFFLPPFSFSQFASAPSSWGSLYGLFPYLRVVRFPFFSYLMIFVHTCLHLPPFSCHLHTFIEIRINFRACCAFPSRRLFFLFSHFQGELLHKKTPYPGGDQSSFLFFPRVPFSGPCTPRSPSLFFPPRYDGFFLLVPPSFKGPFSRFELVASLPFPA